MLATAWNLLPFGQLALVLCLLTALYAPSDALLGVLPTPSSVADLNEVLLDGTAEMREQATPAGLRPHAASASTLPWSRSTSDAESAVWLAVTATFPPGSTATSIGLRCGSIRG